MIARCRKCGLEIRRTPAIAGDLRQALVRSRDHFGRDAPARAYGYLEGVVERVVGELGGLCRYCA